MTIRPEFSSRIAVQLKIAPETMQKALENRPELTMRWNTQPDDAVEIGFERAAEVMSGLKGKDPAAADVDVKALEQQHPEARDAFSEWLYHVSNSADQWMIPTSFSSDHNGVFSLQCEGSSGMKSTIWVDTTPGQAGIVSLMLDNRKIPQE